MPAARLPKTRGWAMSGIIGSSHMPLFARLLAVWCNLALIGAIAGEVSSFDLGTASQIPPPPGTSTSVEVKAHLSPEEVEEGKLNDVYQPLSELQRNGSCTGAVIARYKSEVIVLAEKSSFNVPKNKFLFLANRDIGDCYLDQQNFAEAEAAFQKILQYLPVWPGIDDSAYPINFREIAMAQMGQQRWQRAEESLQKSVSLFNQQIDRAMKSDSEFMRTGHAANLGGSKAMSLAYLGIVYVREGRLGDALQSADLAFSEASKANVRSTVTNSVVKIGRLIAEATGDKNAIAKWAQRN
jgi:tetratricopeptide (TPR) repeat protein